LSLFVFVIVVVIVELFKFDSLMWMVWWKVAAALFLWTLLGVLFGVLLGVLDELLLVFGEF
jgi:hypothetical protein